MDMNTTEEHVVAARDVWGQWNISPCEEGRDWSQPPRRAGEERIRETIAAIPEDVETILDAGCGNGSLCNTVNAQYHVFGFDYAAEALRYVRSLKVRGGSAEAPLRGQTLRSRALLRSA